MDGIGPEIAPAVLAACEANALEIGASFSRAFGFPLLATVGKPQDCGTEPLLEDGDGPGLVFLFKLGDQSAVAMLPESSAMLPAWYSHPDVTGKSKLDTLAQELGMLLFPDELGAESLGTTVAASLSSLLHRGGPTGKATYLPLLLSAGTRQGKVCLLWPVTHPGEVVPGAEAAAPQVSRPNPSATLRTKPPAPPGSAGKLAAGTRAPRPAATLETLPNFSRSLLRIKVPVMVTLATKKQPVSKIVELLPGSIIQFNKSCEEMLELEVSGQPVALGECVKVGDKFGLRVTSLIMPGERFENVRP
jgi:flagellar motor switch protein FliN/FliY